MLRFRWIFLVLTTLFFEGSSLQAGGVLGGMRSLFSQFCPERDSDDDQTDSDGEVESDSVDELVDPPKLSESPLGMQMAKQRVFWSSSASECSTDLSDDDEREHGERRSSYGFSSEVFDVFESIKELTCKKYSDAAGLKNIVTSREYAEFWKEARQNILECRRLIVEFARAIVSKNSFVDERMLRLDNSYLGAPDLSSFEQGYKDLCLVYGQLLHDAVLMGLGSIVACRSDHADINVLPFLGLGSCVSCDVSLRAMDDCFCPACGESLIVIPDDRRDFDQASGEIVELFNQSRACRDVTTLVLQQLKDL